MNFRVFCIWLICSRFYLVNLYGADQHPIQISGVYPHLTMWNDENECGTGAVVPWQGRLWAVTYAPHQPGGSTDKLYEITPDLDQIIFKGSVGGTPANRMIHSESQQLLIGPYVINAQSEIRVISPDKMFGRLTANARHLSEPEHKMYYATMEEGLYEVDLRTLDVHCLIRDGNSGAPDVGLVSKLPGYHGKGMYSGQGQLIYANNGERHPDVSRDPTIASGSLARWTAEGDWQMIRRNQFCEVTGPGGIYGNPHPAEDPIWAFGWDARSLILGLLEAGEWSYYRLPKGSHSYDGSHGWNTEWPRIREIGEEDLLATMHGTFWKFPKAFSRHQSSGIAPRSNYLKVVGDFCRWGDRVVLGCDDSARAEFLNKRSFKAAHGAPKQSNSNLWFVEPGRLDNLGPAIGRGSVWLRDEVGAGQVSDPYLFSGFDYRQIHIQHQSDLEITMELEVDQDGNNQWTKIHTWTLEAKGSHSYLFNQDEVGAWVRVRCQTDAKGVTVHFQYRDKDSRSTTNNAIFDGIASPKVTAATYGLMRSLAHDRLGIVAASDVSGDDARFYTLTPKMELRSVEDPVAMHQLVSDVSQPSQAYSVDAASVVIEDDGIRYRIPRSDEFKGPDIQGGFSIARVCREVATERDLLNIHGTFYELPARNAQGLAKMRPIATHELQIHDFCSHNGLLFFTGMDDVTKSDRIFRSEDGKAAVWAGVVDDLWQLGKPRGLGGPWMETKVEAGEASDPYLMTGYDHKQLKIWSDRDVNVRLEVDIDGTGLWLPYDTFEITGGKNLHHRFPLGYSAYWVRTVCDKEAMVSVQFKYY